MQIKHTPAQPRWATLSVKRSPNRPSFKPGSQQPPVVPTGAAPVPEDHYFYNHVLGRRAPRRRFGTVEEALKEQKRLRAMGLDARTYEAKIVTGAK